MDDDANKDDQDSTTASNDVTRRTTFNTPDALRVEQSVPTTNPRQIEKNAGDDYD